MKYKLGQWLLTNEFGRVLVVATYSKFEAMTAYDESVEVFIYALDDGLTTFYQAESQITIVGS